MRKRLMALLLVIALLASLTACGSENAGTPEAINNTNGSGNNTVIADTGRYKSDYDTTKYNEPGTFPIFKQKQIITVTVSSSTSVEDFNTNWQTKYMEEHLNADLQITVIPSKEYKTKVNLMFAADDNELTDAIMGSFSDSEILAFARDGKIRKLTEYYYNTSIAYYINKAKERVGVDFFPQITMPDGEIYGLPKYSDSVSNINPHKMFVFTPWLEKLGIDRKSVKTLDDFRNLLIRIRDEDPNGNGKKDEIPNVEFSTTYAWFRYLMNPFVYAGNPNYMIVKNGQISLAYQKKEWKDGLKWIKSLYDEGLISPLTFTQDQESWKAMLNQDETIVGTFCALGTGNVTGERRNQYIAIQPLEGPNGSLASYEPTAAEIKMVITNKAKDPEVVFRMGDFMCSEELSVITAYGEPGVDFKYADPNKDVSSFAELGYKAYLIPILTFTGMQNKHWYQTGPYIRQREVTAGVVENAENNSYKAAPSQIMYEGHNPEEYITKLIFTEQELDALGSKLDEIKSYVHEMNYYFITGQKDIDKDWDDFQDQIEKMGAETIITISQAAFDRYNEVMGTKK